MCRAKNDSVDLSVSALPLCAGALPQDTVEHNEKLVGTRQNPRCCGCHRLIRSAQRRGTWPRVKHTPRCPSASVKLPSAAAAAAAPLTPRKRRAQSDPGEPQRPRAPSPRRMHPTTLRVTPPTPAPAPVQQSAQKKARVARSEEDIMRLLDETVAQRTAWLAAQQPSSSNAALH